jgi:hypothetical protein
VVPEAIYKVEVSHILSPKTINIITADRDSVPGSGLEVSEGDKDVIPATGHGERADHLVVGFVIGEFFVPPICLRRFQQCAGFRAQVRPLPTATS